MFYGPSVVHTGVQYGNTNFNVRYGLRRMLSLKFPPETGKDKKMLENQHKFIHQHKWLIDQIESRNGKYFDDYEGMDEEALQHVDDPHLKRLLRLFTWEEIENNGVMFDHLWLTSVLYKMKIREWAKNGKYPRMIGDLGVAASLQGFRLTHFLKKAQANEPIHHEGVEFEFVKTPDPFVLEKVFNKLINPPGRGYFCYFSDDSCYSVRDSNGDVHTFNVDISSCDSSHGDTLFKALIGTIPNPWKGDMTKLVEQCKLPIRIQDLNNKKNVVILKPTRIRLYSGSTITTAINNLASLLIGVALAESHATTSAGLIEAAFKVGYVITCTENETYSDLQFLKNSPVYDTDGVLRPLLNLGVLLRITGTCHDDLPGRKHIPLRQRALNFQRSVLQGAYPRVHFKLIDAMKRQAVEGQFIQDDRIESLLRYKVVQNDKYPVFTVSNSELYKRYHLTPLQVEQVELLGQMSYGEHIANPGLSAVLEKDYDLGCDCEDTE